MLRRALAPLAALVLPALPAAAAETPSFDCATAQTARELAVCAVPAAAAADRALAAAYVAARRRLAPAEATALAADQRAFLGRIDHGFDDYFWGKQEPPASRAERAAAVRRRAAERHADIDALIGEIRARTLVLAAIDPSGAGPVGAWAEHESWMRIGPAENGRHRVEFSSADWSRPKYHCDFSADASPSKGALVAEEVENDEAGRRVTHLAITARGALLTIAEETAESGSDPEVGRACPRIPPLAQPLFRIDPGRLPADHPIRRP